MKEVSNDLEHSRKILVGEVFRLMRHPEWVTLFEPGSRDKGKNVIVTPLCEEISAPLSIVQEKGLGSVLVMPGERNQLIVLQYKGTVASNPLIIKMGPETLTSKLSSFIRLVHDQEFTLIVDRQVMVFKVIDNGTSPF